VNQLIIEKYTVADAEGDRLSDYAVGKFESLPSRKSVKKAIKRKLLLVNGHDSTTGYRVSTGDVLSVIEDLSQRPLYERELSILFEDDHLAAVQKPGDLPTSGNAFRTLQNALSFNLKASPEKDALAVPRPVHRLDRQTSGVVLIAKTISAASHLGKQFEDREVRKTYLAWVVGEVPHSLTLNDQIDGKEAITEVERLEAIDHKRYGTISKVKCRPLTGRRNQIRIHLSESGYPILGDLKFGAQKSGRGLFLFAYQIEFTHPFSGEKLVIRAVPTKKFRL
jgi:RluA family pseudouridine synthase